MELPVNLASADGRDRLRVDVPPRVIIAFDQLTDEERRHVLGALGRIDHEGLGAPGLDVTRLGGALPLYALRATPDVVVILRGESGHAVEVWDIVQPATLEGFAHAG